MVLYPDKVFGIQTDEFGLLEGMSMIKSVSNIVNDEVVRIGLRPFARELDVSPGLVHYAMNNNPNWNSKMGRVLRKKGGYYDKPTRITSQQTWESLEQKEAALRYVQHRGFKSLTEFLRSIGNYDIAGDGYDT